METQRELAERDQPDEIEIDLYELMMVLLRKWWMILIGLLAGVLLAGIYTWVIVKPTYEASSMIYMRGAGNTIASLQDLQIGAELTNDYEVIFKSRPILQEVVDRLGLAMDYKTLKKEIILENPADTRILKVSMVNTDAEMARDIVNTLVDVAMDSVKEIDAKEPYLVEEAVADWQQVGPSALKNLALGGMIGVFAVMGILVLTYVIGDKVRSSEEAERLLNIPVIGSIPESSKCNYERRK